MRSMSKIITTAVISGLLSGLVVYGGVHYYQNGGIDNGHITAVQRTTNVQSQSEQAFKSVRNDVVSVLNMRKMQTIDPTLGSVNQSKLQTASEGSGVIYKISGGKAYLVTNNHVVNGSSELKVVLASGKKVTAKVVGTNKKDDLAVMKINSAGVHHVANFGNSNNIQAGETSLAIGSPLGSSYASTVTKGIISNKSRKLKRVDENNPSDSSITHVIQTDSAINPGNSGGALINLNGQVIGINSAKVASTPQGTSVEGMGFAIPSNEVIKVINQIVSDNQ